MKKLLWVTLIAAAVGFLVVAGLLRQSPKYLVPPLERALGKKVALEAIGYRFPSHFEIRKFAILEKAPFEGETSFQVKVLAFDIDLAALFAKRVVISRVDIKEPVIIVRQAGGRVTHPLSEAAAGGGKPAAPAPAPQDARRTSAKGAKPPLVISRLVIRDGILRWIDFDIVREGFVMEFRRIAAEGTNLDFGGTGGRIHYTIDAEMNQTRDGAPAKLTGRGWTDSATLDTEAGLTIEGVEPPYFAPYYRKVTPAVISGGTLSTQSTTVIQNMEWTTNARLDVRNLEFSQLEPGGLLFGFDAVPLLEILKSQSGNIRLDIIARWNLADPGITFEKVLRKSIERSIKATFLNNIQTVVENTLDKISENPDLLKKDWKNVLNQLKGAVE